mgnify:CR=1 FL=1
MVVDISKITLENLSEYQPRYKKKRLTKKEYNYKYYIEKTKPKRSLKRLNKESD